MRRGDVHRLEPRRAQARARGGAPRIARGRGGGLTRTPTHPPVDFSLPPDPHEFPASILEAFEELLANVEWAPLPTSTDFEPVEPPRRKTEMSDHEQTQYRPAKMRMEELENNYTGHPADKDQEERYRMIRGEALDLAKCLSLTCPSSRELSIALTKLEEVVFWANAAIARNERVA